VHERGCISPLERLEPAPVEPARRCGIEHGPAADCRVGPKHDAVAAGRDDRAFEPELRVLAVANKACGHRLRSDMHRDRGRHRRDLHEPDVEAVRRREVTTRDQNVAARKVMPFELRQIDRDPLPGLRPIHCRVVHLHRSHTHGTTGGLDAQLVPAAIAPDQSVPVATVPTPRSVNTRSTYKRVAPSGRRSRTGRRASASRRSSRPAPVFADTATTSAPRTSSRASSAASSSVSSSTASAFVSATTRARHRAASALRDARASAARTLLRVDHERKRSMPVAPAIIVRTKRSCPARRQARGAVRREARAARSRGRSRCRARAPQAGGRCPCRSAP